MFLLRLTYVAINQYAITGYPSILRCNTFYLNAYIHDEIHSQWINVTALCLHCDNLVTLLVLDSNSKRICSFTKQEQNRKLGLRFFFFACCRYKKTVRSQRDYLYCIPNSMRINRSLLYVFFCKVDKKMIIISLLRTGELRNVSVNYLCTV